MPRKRIECFRLFLTILYQSSISFLRGIRDSRKAESLEVNTPELIGEIKNFMDKDRRVSIEMISAQVWCQCENCTHNYSRGTEDAEDLREVCPKGAQRRSERKTFSWQQGDGRADQFRSRSSWCSSDLRWKLDLLLWPKKQRDRVPRGSMLSPPDSRNPPTNLWWSLFWQLWQDLHALGSHWTDSQQGWVLREFRKSFRQKRPAFFKSGQWHFHQDNAQLHPCHRLFEYDGHQDSSSPPL